MLIIDAHIHFSKIASFQEAAEKESGCDYSLTGLQTDLARNNIQAAIGMGLQETFRFGFPDQAAANPMGLDMSDSWPEGLYFCPGINPHDLSIASLEKIEKALQHPKAVGIKLYPGYYHFPVNDPIYSPVYEQAAQFNLPVVIHSGDTFSDRGLLKYSHPLAIDELAVTHRRNIFVIAHMGDPWVKETAEISRKNPNVWADISGLLVGSRSYFQEMGCEPLILNEFRHALLYAASWDKILFGSDWPLAPVDAYLDFVESIVPEKHLEDVLGKNALNIFPRITEYIKQSEFNKTI
ncbi:MAG TPA: amidohydrolase family protein [Syntrophales bacterium]|nr:amidohydrolase family protein [Syntrophales bacterium]